MRKYRFTSTNSKWAQIKPKLHTLYFFLAWNVAGISFYKFAKHKAGENNEGFDKLSNAEQHMHVVGAKPTLKVNMRNLKYEKIEPYQPFEPRQKSEAT